MEECNISIHRIPDRYLNTTIHFFRESFEFDDVGDLKKNAQSLAYSSIKGNIQPAQKLGDSSGLEYELHGKVYIQDHIGYINRMEEGEERVIIPGDIAYDQETEIKYLVLGIEVWQSAQTNISDSHHIRLILKSIGGVPKDEAAVMNTMVSKASITDEPPPAPLGINVDDSANVIDRLV